MVSYLSNHNSVLQTKQSFELIQSYLTATIKIHRTFIWKATDEPHEELSQVLEDIQMVQRNDWNEMEGLFLENMAAIKWIKNALI
uniref:Utp21 domain-containing protein n=1 Tax=Caenorhabditis tropicalis TaxID=1561998 RepID=A0A1I7UA01_9PELO